MKIIIIDSGVNINHPKLKDKNILGYTLQTGDNFNIIPDCTDELGHGTAICGIISSNDPNHEICMIKAFDENTPLSEEALLYVLEYIYEVLDCDIVHMSLGINMCQDLQRLLSICQKLNERGTLLISAFNNEGAASYPASFDCVIGVDLHLECVKDNDFIYVENSIVNIFAKGGNQKVIWAGSTDYIINAGSSYAAAHVTRFIAENVNLKQAEVPQQYTLEIFKNIAKKIFCFEKQTENRLEFSLGKIATFPFNKEIMTTLSYSDMIKGEIIKVYDVKYLGKIGCKTSSYLHRSDESFIIENIENFKNDANKIDSLVIGHTEEIFHKTKINYQKILIDICANHKINVFSFDDFDSETNEVLTLKGFKCYTPNVKKRKIYNFNKLKSIGTPILTVAGTASKQGKFSLQLALRKEFLSHGYKIGQWSTEPQAALFGIDVVFPSGFGSFLNLPESDIIEIINSQLAYIEEKNIDLIITGLQSFILPFDLINSFMYPEYQPAILSALQPDAIVLCMSIDDELEYIDRVIKYSESITGGKVIVGAIYPRARKQTWSSNNLIEYDCTDEDIWHFASHIKNCLNLTVYSMDDINSIMESVLNYFY